LEDDELELEELVPLELFPLLPLFPDLP